MTVPKAMDYANLTVSTLGTHNNF